MNTDHKLACSGLREDGSKDVDSTTYQTRAMASVMQAAHKEEMITLVNALQQVLVAGKWICFGCGREGHFKRELPNKTKGSSSASTRDGAPRKKKKKKDFIRPVGPSSISRWSL